MLTRRLLTYLALSLVTMFSCARKESKPSSLELPDRGSILIAVNQYVEHPNLALVFEGFKETVDSWGKVHGVEVRYDRKIAGADASVATQIARQQISANPRLILALATPSAQAAARVNTTVPIVFGAITDPVAAGLVKSLAAPGGNVTGSSDIGPYRRQFELIRKLLPAAKTVGVIRNPGESNSVSSMALIDPAIQRAGFKKIEASVATTSEVLAAARSLVGRCDLFYMPADNTVLSALPAVAGVCDSNKIPLFVGDEGSVDLGAAATIGIDYYQLGRATGEIATRILNGESPAKIPVAFGTADRVVVNLEAAKKQGVQFPTEVLKGAKVLKQ